MGLFRMLIAVGTVAFAGGVQQAFRLFADTVAFVGESGEGEVLGRFEEVTMAFLGRGKGVSFRAGAARARTFRTAAFLTPRRWVGRIRCGPFTTSLWDCPGSRLRTGCSGVFRFRRCGLVGTGALGFAFARFGRLGGFWLFGASRFLPAWLGAAFGRFGPGFLLVRLQGKAGEEQGRRGKTDE